MKLFLVLILAYSYTSKMYSQDTLLINPLVINSIKPVSQIGIASFYSKKFNGRRTSSGELFSNTKMTAAHKNLKFGTYVKVRNLNNDSTVIVKINDRLPQKSKRSIDLSISAAKQLNFIKKGLTKVEITVLDLVEINNSN